MLPDYLLEKLLKRKEAPKMGHLQLELPLPPPPPPPPDDQDDEDRGVVVMDIF